MSEDQEKVPLSEELEEGLGEILDFMAEAGRRADAIAKEKRLNRTQMQRVPDVRSEVYERLRLYLEDEVVVAMPLGEGAEIDPREEQREISKRALARLRLSQLRAIAEGSGLPKSGNRDEVLDRLARHYGGDETEIARLVVENEPEPSPELRHTTRVYALWESAKSDAIASRLSAFKRRYLRTGIAQWFVFSTVSADDRAVRVEGSYRAVSVSIAQAENDEEGEFVLAPRSRELPASVRVRRDCPFVEVRAKGERESESAMRAISHATPLRRREQLPADAFGPLEGEIASWDFRTLWMLDVLNTFFMSEHVKVANLTGAGFETSKTSDNIDAPDRPQVQSVRFHGQHILDSRPACELVARGERIASLTLLAFFTPRNDESYVLPVRIGLEKDHFSVMTGFGTHRPEISSELQRSLVAFLERGLLRGIEDERSLRQLAARIRERAAQSEAPEHADLFVTHEEIDDNA